MIRSAFVINLGVVDRISLGDSRQPFNIDTLLHQGHVLLRLVVPKAQVLLAILEHDLEWLKRKALLGHALNAPYLVVSSSELLDSFGEDVEAFGNIRLTILGRNNKRELEVQVELILDAEARGLAVKKLADILFFSMFVVRALGPGFCHQFIVLAVS